MPESKNQFSLLESFKIVKHYLHSAVPPCTVTVDEPHHFEVAAINGDQKHIFGYCVCHQDEITLGFNTEIPEEDLKQLMPKDLIRRLNENRRLEIHRRNMGEMRQDIQDTCDKMLYYFDQKGWTKF